VSAGKLAVTVGCEIGNWDRWNRLPCRKPYTGSCRLSIRSTTPGIVCCPAASSRNVNATVETIYSLFLGGHSQFTNKEHNCRDGGRCSANSMSAVLSMSFSTMVYPEE
jgi:hypothetical protein